MELSENAVIIPNYKRTNNSRENVYPIIITRIKNALGP